MAPVRLVQCWCPLLPLLIRISFGSGPFITDPWFKTPILGKLQYSWFVKH